MDQIFSGAEWITISVLNKNAIVAVFYAAKATKVRP